MPFSIGEVDTLLNPTSIAVVGASENSIWSREIVRNLRTLGFAGTVHLVNPKRATAFGQQTYPSIKHIPVKVDHALLLTPAETVPSILEDALASGVRAATVVAAGFQEAGERGAALAKQIKEFCETHRIALVGPNCYGFLNYFTKSFLTRSPLFDVRAGGKIGMSFQSGGLAVATAQCSHARGIALGIAVSSGNELVVNANDYYEYFLSRDDIAVIGGTLERIPEPERFAEIATRARKLGKPVVVLKFGRSTLGQQLAVAHTGSVAGSDVVADTFLRDLGVIRVESIEELVDTAGLLAEYGWPKGRSTFFPAFSGGICGLIAELAEPAGIDLRPIDTGLRDTLATITGLTPDVVHNPFDGTTQAVPYLREILEAVSDPKKHDVVLMNLNEPRDEKDDGRGKMDFATVLVKMRERGVYVAGFEAVALEPTEYGIKAMRGVGVPMLRGRDGAKALGNAMWYGVRRAELEGEAPSAPPSAPLEDGLLRDGVLSERESKEVVSRYGIALPMERLVTSPDAAIAAAAEIGFPVVLKIVSSDIAHKSEVGGVLMGLNDREAVRAGYETVLRNAATYKPDAKIEGVLVCESIQGGMEFFIGVTSDEALGHIVVAGLGGIYVEILSDVVTMTPPISRQRAAEQLRKLKSAPILAGARGKNPLDFEAFVDAVVGVGQLAHANRSRIAEVDINPLFVLEKGRGVRAADALVVVKPGRSLA